MTRKPDVSDAEIEERIIRALERHPSLSKQQLHQLVGGAAKRFRAALERLESRGVIAFAGRSRHGHALVVLCKESRSTEIQSTSTLIDHGSAECIESSEMQRPVPADLVQRVIAMAAQFDELLQALGVDEPESLWDREPDSDAIWVFAPFDGGIN